MSVAGEARELCVLNRVVPNRELMSSTASGTSEHLHLALIRQIRRVEGDSQRIVRLLLTFRHLQLVLVRQDRFCHSKGCLCAADIPAFAASVYEAHSMKPVR